MKRIVYNKWYGGISNDMNSGQVGSQSNIEGLDTHSNSKYARLSKSHNGESLINTRSAGKIVASLYESNTNYLELSADGYLTGILANDTNSGNVVSGDLGDGRNLGKITIGSGGTYGFMISSSGFNYWTYDSNVTELGTYNTGTGIQTDPEFDLGTGWTIGANWTISGGKATHTVGSTAVLSRSMTCDNATRYRLATYCTVTAGTCAVKIAGTTIYTLGTANSGKSTVEIYTSASTSELLEFVPSTDFAGNISYCRIQKLNILSSTKTFSALSPYIIFLNYILIGNGNIISSVNMTSGTPIITDVLTVAKDYTIVGITRIADQIFVYATNGTNGRQYIWDGITTAPTREITWVDKPIQNVANFANIDYVVVGTTTRQQICIVNGYQLQPLVVTDDYINTDARIYFNANYTNSVETIGNRLLIGGNGGVFGLGNKTPGLPTALVKEFIYNDGSVTNMFYSESLGHSLFVYFYSTINGVAGNYRVQIYFPEGSSNEKFLELNNRGSGWIETQPIYGDTYSNIKNLNKYTIGLELDTGTYINTYIKEISTENYANLYFTGDGTGINVGDTYTYSSRTFTVISKIQSSTDACFLHCSYSGAKLTLKQYGTFTRATGTGLSTFYADRVRYGYEMIYSHSDTTKLRETINTTRTFHKTNFAIELLTTNELYSPKIYDFNVYFNEVTND